MNKAVILAGGSGTRFWPLSRKSKPKQCLAIHSKKPMIVETSERLRPIFKENIFISTSRLLSKQIHTIMPDAKFIIEPMPKNTAACIGLSAITLLQNDPEAVMFIETSDHVYNDVKKYHEHVKLALKLAKTTDKIILIGIKPTSAHTGLGYIEYGSVSENAYETISFKEKPDLNTAKKYFESQNFLWNSGMFTAKCSVILDEIKAYMPKLYDSLIAILKSNFDKKTLEYEFKKLQSISIDYGILEKSKNTLVIKADMHWDDIGDFGAFERTLNKDKNNNSTNTTLANMNSHDNIVIGDKLVALVNVNNLIVVQTDDTVLITDKNNSQDIKKLVEKMSKDDKLKKYLE